MYEQYLRDPASVGEEWRNLFDNGRLAELPVIPTSRDEVLRETGGGRRESAAATAPQPTPPASRLPAPGLTPITGPAARLVQNMTDSLSVPTATSFRDIVVETLDARRKELNAQLVARGKKISFTHLIGFAIVQAAKQLPGMTHAFQEVEGKPHRLDPQGVNLGLAVDVEKKDGSRALVVPVIRHAERMDFAAFHATYETLVDKARTNKLLPDDFAGATNTLPNPGTIGTVASVPRLMKGQRTIIATGAIRQIGPAKVMTLTSTYDHRVIQGAESGMFLRRIDGLLQGDENFYGGVLESLGLTGGGTREAGAVVAAEPTLPVSRLSSPDDLRAVAAAMALVKAFRNFGHMAARLTRSAPIRRAIRRSIPGPSASPPRSWRACRPKCCGSTSPAEPSATRTPSSATRTAAPSPTRSSTSGVTWSACGCDRRSNPASTARHSRRSRSRSCCTGSPR